MIGGMQKVWIAMLALLAGTGCGRRSASTTPLTAAPWSVALVVVDTEDLASIRATMLANLESPMPNVRLGIVLAESERTRFLHLDGGGHFAPTNALDGADIRSDEAFARIGAWLSHEGTRSAVVLWGHGRGWRGFGTNPRRRDRRHWSLFELSHSMSVLRDGLGRPLDMLGFDACLMGSWEVASAVAPFARTLVASPELEPRRGWPIASIMKWLDAAPSSDGVDLARETVERFAKSGHRHAVLGAFDLTKLPELDQAVEALGAAATLRSCTLPESPAYRDDGARDLGGLARALAADCPAVARSASAVDASVSRARLALSCGAARCEGSGMSIHVGPAPEETPYTSEHAPAWNRWATAQPVSPE